MELEASQNTMQGLEAQLKKEEELKNKGEEAFDVRIYLVNVVSKGIY